MTWNDEEYWSLRKHDCKNGILKRHFSTTPLPQILFFFKRVGIFYFRVGTESPNFQYVLAPYTGHTHTPSLCQAWNLDVLPNCQYPISESTQAHTDWNEGRSCRFADLALRWKILTDASLPLSSFRASFPECCNKTILLLHRSLTSVLLRQATSSHVHPLMWNDVASRLSYVVHTTCLLDWAT